MARALENTTLSATDEKRHASHPEGSPYLFLVLESHRPFSAPVRIALDGFDEVVLGRGSTRTIERDDEGGVRSLRIRLDDDWLSRRHARLTRVLRRWVLEDMGSKNGSYVDAVRRSQAELVPGSK